MVTQKHIIPSTLLADRAHQKYITTDTVTSTATAEIITRSFTAKAQNLTPTDPSWPLLIHDFRPTMRRLCQMSPERFGRTLPPHYAFTFPSRS